MLTFGESGRLTGFQTTIVLLSFAVNEAANEEHSADSQHISNTTSSHRPTLMLIFYLLCRLPKIVSQDARYQVCIRLPAPQDSHSTPVYFQSRHESGELTK